MQRGLRCGGRLRPAVGVFDVPLRMTADRVPGVLLLDHTREVTTAMIGFLRRLRGGIVGTLLVVDVDSDFERDRLCDWRRHTRCVRMLVHAARRRVGWLSDCVRRLQMSDYWHGGSLHVSGLCTDIEIPIRESVRGPRMCRRSIRAGAREHGTDLPPAYLKVGRSRVRSLSGHGDLDSPTLQHA
jgi:hypothetical protein